ncbi:MAG: hypothetical protein ACM3NF_11235, partial [Gemmatimonadota bacterium]
AILPDEFSLFRPEALYEASSGRVFMTGYGTAGCTFQAVKLNAAAASVDRVSDPAQFALTEPPSSLAGDYTKAAFGFPGGKIVAFWSGRVGDTGDRNLDVTTVPTVAAWVQTSESGCAMAGNPGSGAGGRIPGNLLIFLPAIVLAARRIVVACRRRREPEPSRRARSARRTVGR